MQSRIKNILKFKKCGKFAITGAVLVCVAVLILGLTNGVSKGQKQPSTFAEELYEAKIPYIGDASAVGNLVGITGVRELGAYTMELQTTIEPYYMKIIFEEEPENQTQFNFEMRKKASVLLALIENAGEIRWNYPVGDEIYGFSCSLQSANMFLGVENVKEFAKSPTSVQEMVDILEERGEWKLQNEKAFVAPNGEIYKYRKKMTGRHPNAKADSTLIVYTNEDNLTFEDVSRYVFSSLSPDKREHQMYVSFEESMEFLE